MKLTIRNCHPRIRPSLKGLERALGKFAREGKKKVDVLLMGDREIAHLAGKFRRSPYPTDVLAFEYPDGDFLGEVAISLDTAKRQAKERKVPLIHELGLLVTHGLLHILGEDDESYMPWCRMRTREFEIMVKLL